MAKPYIDDDASYVRQLQKDVGMKVKPPGIKKRLERAARETKDDQLKR